MAEIQHPDPDAPVVLDPEPAPAAPAQAAEPAVAAVPAPAAGNQQELENLKEEVKVLKESLEAVTKASLESLVKKILTYSTRPLTEFNKYEALGMLESLQNTACDKRHEKANYYRLAYQTARNNVDKPKAPFYSLMTRLIGDKDHEKVLDIEAKVAKAYRVTPRSRGSYATPYGRPERDGRSDVSRRRCFECDRPGHYKADCPYRSNPQGVDKGYFAYNTLPFGWKISPYVYHTTGLLASSFFRSIGIPCSLYIDDRHNAELQVPLNQGEYSTLVSEDAGHRAAAESAVFLVAYYLVKLGYFLGLAKSTLAPQKIVPYLGFLSDSGMEVFHLKPEKKENFLSLLREVLAQPFIKVKTLQRLVGKCVSFGLAVPAARLFYKGDEHCNL